jgi:hypothetical protein
MKRTEAEGFAAEFARSLVFGLRNMQRVQTEQESLLKDYCIRLLQNDGVKLPEKYSCGIINYAGNHFTLAICETPMWEHAHTLEIKFYGVDFSYTIKHGHAEEEEV